MDEDERADDLRADEIGRIGAFPSCHLKPVPRQPLSVFSDFLKTIVLPQPRDQFHVSLIPPDKNTPKI